VQQIMITIFLFGAAALEVLVLPRVTPFGLFPDLVLGVILVASALEGMRAGFLWAAMGGLALDLLAASPLGGHFLALVPAVLAGTAARQSIYRSALLPLMGILGGLTLAYRAILLFVHWPARWEAWLDAGVTAMLVGILNLIAVPLVYGIILLAGRLGVRRAH
jgi:rod shape-determining protein MreD